MSRTRSFVVLTTLLAGLAVFAGAAAQTHDHGSHDGHDHGPGQPPGQKLTTAPPGTVPRAPRGRAIQLVATVPVESSIGDPTLPGTAETWVSMIDSARKTIELEHFYLSHWPGERTGPVLDAIGRAARRGVQVRILLDARFRSTYPQPAESLGNETGIEVRWLDMKQVSGSGVQHAKFMVVDQAWTFVGSQNFDWRALKHIHELGVKVWDPRVAGMYQRVFEYDWKVAEPGAEPAVAGSAGRLPSAAHAMLPLRLLQAEGDTAIIWPTFSPQGHIPDSLFWDLDHILRLIDSARDEVVVQLLSYGLGRGAGRDSSIDVALRRAARRGVKVRMLVSDWQADNARIKDLQSLTEVPNVEAKLSTVPEWSGGYIPFARVEHCKYMVVDTLWTWVGTSNWEPDYFHTSRNAALAIANRNIARQARAIFETGWGAKTARTVKAGATYTPKLHREQAPPGRKVYGR
jgi:phosphatidylserine/phosphatidylglycerophosphate/cardiolipin synthase-like enzyme